MWSKLFEDKSVFQVPLVQNSGFCDGCHLGTWARPTCRFALPQWTADRNWSYVEQSSLVGVLWACRAHCWVLYFCFSKLHHGRVINWSHCVRVLPQGRFPNWTCCLLILNETSWKWIRLKSELFGWIVIVLCEWLLSN